MVRFLRIKWPAPGFGSTLDFELPAHRPLPRTNWVGERADAPSGLIDTWEEAVHAEFEFELRRIPTQASGGASGWHGAGGVNAWRLYALGGGQFQLFLDRDDVESVHVCQLVREEHDREDSKVQAYRLQAVVRDVSGLEFEV